MTSKNQKIIPNQYETKNQTERKYVFSWTLKVKKKTSNMNSPHQMELFDTNIDCFSGINQCQRYFSLSTAGIQRPLSLLSQSGTKK